jgi:hypothetical protein
MKMRSKLMQLFLFCVASVIISPVYAANEKYTMEDLYALDKQGSYMELISHMNDIGPTNRDEAWQTLVQHAVAKTVEQLSAAGDFYAAADLAEQVLDSNPVFKTSKEFMDLRSRAVINGFTLCYKDSYDGSECTQRLKNIVKKEPVDQELAFQAGKLVRLNLQSSAAVPFFIQALQGQQNAEKCGDPDVLQAVKSGMGLPPNDAKEAQELGFSICFDALKTQLTEDFYQSSGYAAANYCDSLSHKKLLTEFQQTYCADLKE